MPETPSDLAWNFLMKVQALDVTARDSVLRPKVLGKDSKGELVTGVENLEIRETETINPLDVKSCQTCIIAGLLFPCYCQMQKTTEAF